MTWLLGRPRREGRMPDRFYKLSQYNGERARGIQHDPAWVEEMRALQADFDEWVRQQAG